MPRRSPPRAPPAAGGPASMSPPPGTAPPAAPLRPLRRRRPPLPASQWSPAGRSYRQNLGGLCEQLGKAGDGGDGRALQLPVNELVILHRNLASANLLQGVILVQPDELPRRHGAGAQQLCPQGRG